MQNSKDIFDEFVQNDDITLKFLDNLSEYTVKLLVEKSLKLASAESLTGGMISSCITSVAGASQVFELGVCSYTDRIKNQVLNVSNSTLEKYSSVSEQAAVEMAQGIMNKSEADIAVAVTGLAGPAGDNDEKPVGTVFLCVIYKNNIFVEDLKLYEKFKGLSRNKIRRLTTAFALQKIIDTVNPEENDYGHF